MSLARDSESEIAGDMSFVSSAGGYVQSKWVAEVRLRSAFKMGAIRDVKILRPGLISSNAKTGSSNMSDWFVRFIHGAILLNGYRVANELDDVLCFTSVDDVACVVNTFALSNGKDRAAVTYHVPITIKMKTAKFFNHVVACKSMSERT